MFEVGACRLQTLQLAVLGASALQLRPAAVRDMLLRNWQLSGMWSSIQSTYALLVHNRWLPQSSG